MTGIACDGMLFSLKWSFIFEKLNHDETQWNNIDSAVFVTCLQNLTKHAFKLSGTQQFNFSMFSIKLIHSYLRLQIKLLIYTIHYWGLCAKE